MHPGSAPTKLRRSPSVACAVDQAIEQLESRRLLTVTSLPNQWSTFTDNTPAGGQKIYVDNGKDGNVFRGDDSWDGLAPIWTGGTHGPRRTLGEAKKLLRDGKPDWLLLKRGDTWNEAIGSIFNKSGISHNDPIVISYYDAYDDFFNGPTYYDFSTFPEDAQFLNLAPRPIINSGTSDGISLTGNSSHVDIVGIEFFASTYNGTNSSSVAGIRAQLTGTDYLVEDVKVRGYRDNVAVGNPGTPVDGFIIRRSQILDAYNTGGQHAQGMYASGYTSNVTIEENTFDHNGWKVDTDKTVFNHDMYINTGAQNVVVQRNVITRGALRGTLLRAGGKVFDNFYAQNAVAVQVGNTASQVEGNVILQGVDQPDLYSGVGIDVAFSIPSVSVKNNIIAHDNSSSPYNLSGINLNGGTNNATVTGNIVYDWRRTFINGADGGSNIVQNNVFQDFDDYHPVIKETGSATTTYGNNTYYSGDESRAFQDGNNRMNFSSWKASHGSDSTSQDNKIVAYIDPNRDMATYNGTLQGSGAATFNAWITKQRAQSREVWNEAYTAGAAINYIKAGFSTTTGTPPPPIPPQVIDVVATDPTASEIGPDTGTFTLTRTGTAAQLLLPMQVNVELGGSATINADYTINPSSFEFPSFVGTSQSITIVVTPQADSLIEGDETVKLKILAKGPPTNPDYVTSTNPNATVNISDSTIAVTVQAPLSQAEERGPFGVPVNGQFTLTRSGPTTSPLTVNLLWAGEADGFADYTLGTPANTNRTDVFDANNKLIGGTLTFPIGFSEIDIDVMPIDDGIAEGSLDENDVLQPGDESVSLTVLPNGTLYTPVNTGATVTIYDSGAVIPPPPPDGGGGGSSEPPLGHGLYERYVNAQDSFVGPPNFITGTIVYQQTDERPGFNFSDSPNHPGVNPNHFSVVWTGQIQPQYSENYTLYLPLDGDASAKIYVQEVDPTNPSGGIWHLVATTNDTDPTKLQYRDANNNGTADYFTHRIGDADDNAVVDSSDFTQMSAHFGGAGGVWANGDFNLDGTINALDFNAVAANYGTSDPRPASHEIKGVANFFDAGVRYNIAVLYSDKVSTAKVRLMWSSPSRPKQEVPLDRLYASAAATGPGIDPLASAANAAFPSLFGDNAIQSGGDGSDVLG